MASRDSLLLPEPTEASTLTVSRHDSYLECAQTGREESYSCLRSQEDSQSTFQEESTLLTTHRVSQKSKGILKSHK